MLILEVIMVKGGTMNHQIIILEEKENEKILENICNQHAYADETC